MKIKLTVINFPFFLTNVQHILILNSNISYRGNHSELDTCSYELFFCLKNDRYYFLPKIDASP
jgi:hypothetical protein